jgi:hypothetical protein
LIRVFQIGMLLCNIWSLGASVILRTNGVDKKWATSITHLGEKPESGCGRSSKTLAKIRRSLDSKIAAHFAEINGPDVIYLYDIMVRMTHLAAFKKFKLLFVLWLLFVRAF